MVFIFLTPIATGPADKYEELLDSSLITQVRRELTQEGVKGLYGADPKAKNYTWCILGEDSLCGNSQTAYLCTGRERGTLNVRILAYAHSERQESYNGFDSATGIVFMTLAGIGVVLTVITLAIVIRHRSP